ncbi:recombinase family protein [candidate division KSB1 bacterium]|nr:recombinase family protein [candidate division KSB1 bacterium]
MSSSKKVKAICDKKSKDPSRHLRPRLDKRQDIQNQLRELRRWAKKMVYKIHQEYVDNESGIKGRGQRQQFTQMFQDAAQRKFDLVLFWALDRFTERVCKDIYCLQQLDSHNVKFQQLHRRIGSWS